MSQFLKNSRDCEDEIVEKLRRGPWTADEDFTLINYIDVHGEGRWNTLARCSGLNRTGKSCRLRWLNYLRPDVRRGNITLEEQLLILELHSRWGNRWSKIAQYLPGRTDNEIKNYWRTRVQKQAKQLQCDVNSKQFKDTMRYLWMPRSGDRIRYDGGPSRSTIASSSTTPGNIFTVVSESLRTEKLYPGKSEIHKRDCWRDQDPPLTAPTSYLIHSLESSTDQKEALMDGGDDWDHVWVGDDEMWSLQQQVHKNGP